MESIIDMEIKEEEGKIAKKKKSILSTILKVFLWIIASVLFLVMLVLILIQTSFVQNFARKKIVAYLHHKLNTKVEIGKIDIDFPTTLSLQNVFIADQSKDTLLYGKELKVNMDMAKLISNNIDIKEITLNGVIAKIKRLPPDSVFNFQFVVNAFNTSNPNSTSASKDTSGLQMNIGQIRVNQTRIIYKDLLTGNDIDLAFRHFVAKISTFDPSHLLFAVPSITLNGLKGHFYQSAPLKQPLKAVIAEAQVNRGNYLQLLNDEINLADINVSYRSEPSHINTSFVISKAQLHPKKIDLKNSRVTLKNASVSNSDITIETASKAKDQKPPDSAATAPSTSPMTIIADEVSIKDLNLKYDDQSLPEAPYGMDYSHLGMEQLSLKASNVVYSADTITASIQSASMREKSGFVLNNLTTRFSMNPTGVSLENLLIETPGSQIRRHAVVSYPSLTALHNDPGKLGLDLDLRNSKISRKDLLTFVPQLRNQTSWPSHEATFFVDAKITGQVNNLLFHRLVVRGLTTTSIIADGTVKGLPKTNHVYADLHIIKFQTSKKDILAFAPPAAIPKNISLPASFSVNGQIKGSMNNLYADLQMNSSSGDAAVKGTLQNITNKNKASYDISLHAGNLQLGTIMQNPKLGPLTGDFKAKGTGYDPQTARAVFSSTLTNAMLNHYNYHNLQAHGSIGDKNYNINMTVDDPNLTAKADVNGNLAGKYPTVHLESIIDSIKTLPLHLTAKSYLYHGDIVADFSNLDPDHPDGNLQVTHSILVTDSNRITIDSLTLSAANHGATEQILLKTNFLTASIDGQYQLTKLGEIFQHTTDVYDSLSSSKNTMKVAPYDFTLNASITDNKALHALLPALSEFSSINMHGNFASDSGWSLYLKSPHLVYGSNQIDSLHFKAATQNQVLAFSASMQRFKSGSSIDMYATSLDGTFQKNNLDFTLDIKDRLSKDKYRLSGRLDHVSTDKYILILKPDNLLLNYDRWSVNAGNQIVMENKKISANDFILTYGTQQLSLNSNGTGANVPLNVSFKNFKLSTITGIIQTDSVMVNGLLNGSAIIKNWQGQPEFTSDLTVSNLSIYNDTLGNLTAKVDNHVINKYQTDIALEGRGNDVKIIGDYQVIPNNSTYHFVIDLESLQMKTVEGFARGAIKDASGNLYGKIAMNGTLNNPNIDGNLHFNNTAFNVSTLNNVYKIDNEAIAIINNKGILFNQFTVHDASGNAIVIDGMLYSGDFLNYTFDFKVRADNFQAINSSSRDNQLFYGKMVFSTNLTVTGSPNHPVVDGNLVINRKTDFTVVLPQNTPGIVTRKGIVRFVDRRATREDSLFMAPYDSLKKAPFRGYDVSLNIKIDKEAIFNMIIDAGNGDFVRLQGDGQLTGGIDASGKVTLTGSYEIDQGAYNFTYNFLKRKFNIQKGSKIVWTGEPTTGQLDVTATYIANTAPIDLVQGQIESANQSIFKQRLPFEVDLKLQGELLQPAISFDVVLPKDQNYEVSSTVTSTVRAKLDQLRQEPNEMNKQVFALLLFNRFVGENPFATSSGSVNAGFVAMQSASRLLSEQLNQLTQNLVPGVNINMDLATTQDYTTGTEQNRTNLNVGLTKQLFNDRLNVTVGSDFQLQGPTKTSQQQNSLAGNISVNYKLTKDGRFEIRVYRKNDYTGELEGYVIETGIGFIVSVDFNRFNQIFKGKDQGKKIREINQQNKKK